MNKFGIWIVILCAAFAGSILTGCSNSNSSTSESPSVQSSVSSEQSSEISYSESTSAESSKEEIAELEQIVKIKSYSLAKDYSGKDALVVTYEWTNMAEKPTSFMVSVFDKLYQNGVELGSAIGVDEADAQKQMNDVKPGVTYEITAAYVLQDMSDVSVECTDMFGTEMYLEQTLSLGDL